MPIDTTDPAAVSAALAAPFDATEVKFKPQTISGNRALAIPYVDARVIQDRLDDVLGVMGWQDKYECQPDGSVVCQLSVRIAGEWITKTDVGGQSEQPDEGDRRKAAFSDALKRAAVKFGIGRYLYRLKPQWLDYDPQKKRFVQQPVLGGAQTPARAPGARSPDQSPPPQQPPPANGQQRGPYGERPAVPPPAEPVRPYDADHDPAEIIVPYLLEYLLWLAGDRGISAQGLRKRFGVQTLTQLTVADYRVAVDGLTAMPRRVQRIAS